jgi:glycosyltransferase involved in cell wall biosynthesis
MSRVLLVAPTIDRDDIGEAWVAYQWASRLAAVHDLTVLTYRKRGHPPIADQLPDARVVEWVEPPLVGRAERLNSLLKPAYLPFYVRARRWIRRALRAGETFDVAHQPVPVAMRYPSPAVGLGIPLVFGPVGGGLSSPAAFEDEDTAPWYVGLRRVDGWRLRHDRLLRRTYTDAELVLGIAPYVWDQLAGVPLRHRLVMAETALAELPEAPPERPAGDALRLLFVGRVVRTKGARDAVAAMAHLRDLPVTLDVVGEGFDRPECEALARRLGVGDRVTFHGRRSRAEVAEFYRRADVFVFPSYREPGGNVPFEAMGYGLPLVVSDRGGPANVVDDSCGIRVTPQEPEQYAHDIATAVRALHESPQRRAAMGRAALERVRAVGLWDAKIRQIGEIYAQVGA